MRLSAALLLCPAIALSQPAVDLELGGERGAPPARAPKAPAPRARSVEIRGGWSKRVALPLRPCDAVTAQSLSAAMEALQAAITGPGRAELPSIQQAGTEIEVLYIDVDLDESPGSGKECEGAASTVGVVFKPYHVHLSLERVGDNVLPVPRLPFAAPPEVNQLWSALRPGLGMGHDHAFGTWVDAQVHTPEEHVVRADARMRESLTSGFYQAGGALSHRGRLGSGTLREYRVHAGVDSQREPLAETETKREATELGAGLKLQLTAATPLFADAEWRQARDRVSDPALAQSDRTDLLAFRVLADRLVPSTTGFLRGSLWQDNGRSVGPERSFQRLVARAGYAQEIRVSPGNTLAFEIVAGAGKLWGEAPAANRFFGGNSATQFLYEGALSRQMLDMPRGPLIRSFGESQAGLGGSAADGGSAFWHLNLTLALPIPGLSRPLIPNVPTGLTGKDGQPVSVKQILRSQVDNSGPAMLEPVLRNQGLSPEEARSQAKAAFAEIQPAARYIIDDAYLYALRPLLMLDTAELRGGLGGASARWTALGAGVSATFTVARFEAGYMRTVSGPEPRSGAGFMRLVFQNLF